MINRQPLYHGKTVILQQNDLSISNNVRHNIKRILNENRTLKQQDFADAIDMDKSQFHRMLKTPTAIDVDYVVKWMKWLGIDWIELIEKPIIHCSMYCTHSSEWELFGRNTRSAIQGTSSRSSFSRRRWLIGS